MVDNGPGYRVQLGALDSYGKTMTSAGGEIRTALGPVIAQTQQAKDVFTAPVLQGASAQFSTVMDQLKTTSESHVSFLEHGAAALSSVRKKYAQGDQDAASSTNSLRRN
jgi:uncharacterized protein YukE